MQFLYACHRFVSLIIYYYCILFWDGIVRMKIVFILIIPSQNKICTKQIALNKDCTLEECMFPNARTRITRSHKTLVVITFPHRSFQILGDPLLDITKGIQTCVAYGQSLSTWIHDSGTPTHLRQSEDPKFHELLLIHVQLSTSAP